MKMNIFVLGFLLFYIHNVKSLKCYTCSCTEDDSDTSCLDNLGAKDGDITDCDKKYCYIVRVDYKDPRGKLQSITRTCVDKPAYTNEVIEDTTHRSYYRACRSELCNDGNGRTDASSGETGIFGDKSTIYVPGTGTNGGVTTKVFLFVNVIGFVILYFAR